MRRAPLAWLVGASLVAAACAFVSPPGAPPAQLSVRVWSSYPPLARTPEPEAVEILLDLTTSMRAHTRGGPRRYAAAREAAAHLVESIPGETPLGVSVLGLARGADCVEATRVARGAPQASRADLTAYLRTIQPGSEGSLAQALTALSREIGAVAGGARVVIYTDLGGDCGGDPCAAAAPLVEAGATLDLVLLGDAAVPACFAELASAGPPGLALARAPSFRVESHTVGSESPGSVLARGVSDGVPVTVPAGAAAVILETDPPSTIGPMLLSPDTLTRVQVLDFPVLRPPVREWRWDVEPLGAAPPRESADASP